MKVDLPFLRHIGAELVRVGSQEALLKLDVKDYHLQHLGYVHGGVISSLADNTGWYAVVSTLSDNMTAVTIEIKVNYLKPARKQVLYSYGRVLRIGKRVGFAVVEVKQGDELVAYATGSYALLSIDSSKQEG